MTEEPMTHKNNKDYKILVMDDEKGIRDFLSYELGLEGYTVDTACDGQEGVEKVKKGKINIVISDLKMPVMDGIQSLEAIKEIDPDIEVIMVTGFGTIETAVDAMKKGAFNFVQKPFNVEELLAQIEKALEKAQLKSLITLYETSKIIFSKVHLDELLQDLVNLSIRLLKADDVSIMLFGDDSKLYIAAAKGVDDALKQSVRLALGERVAGKIAEWKESAIIVGPLNSDPRFSGLDSREEIISSIVCPMLLKNEVIGVICVNRTSNPIHFNQSDQRHAHIFISLITQAIVNAKLYRELEEKIEALEKAHMVVVELTTQMINDLSIPLQHISKTAESLMSGCSGSQAEDLKTIKKEAECCSDVVTNFFGLAQKYIGQEMVQQHLEKK